MGSDRIKLGVKNAAACECESQTAFATLAFCAVFDVDVEKEATEPLVFTQR
jgi:hypothetical protein